MNWKTIYPSKHIQEYIYEVDNRRELVEKYKSKYGDRKLESRLTNRRNITNAIRNAMAILVDTLVSSCPMETGNGRLNGIRYSMTSSNGGRVTVGDPSAPYLVHLSYGIRLNAYSYWINDAIQKAIPRINKLNKIIGQDEIMLDVIPTISNGLTVIDIYTL
jgi:hypothetical protein